MIFTISKSKRRNLSSGRLRQFFHCTFKNQNILLLKNTKNALLSEANKTFSEVYYYFLPKNLIGLQDARLDLHPYKNREMGVFN